MSLKVGDRAPDFSVPTDIESNISLSNFKGKKAVIFFYPRDNTPGCTKECVQFSEAIDEFASAGTVVIGTSKDSIKSHVNFRQKHNLQIYLASDSTGSMVAAYGVWVEKQNYGRKYMGIERSTFLVDESGIIRRIWRKVRVANHVDDVLEAIKSM